MGLVRAWRRQIYGASLVAVLIPAAIIVALFAVTGGGPLHGLGALGQVFSGPAIPGGNQSAKVVTNSKPALPGKGTVGAAALRGHSPLVRSAAGPSAGGSHVQAATPVHPGSAGSGGAAPSATGGRLNGGGGTIGGGGSPGGGSPPPPVTTPPTTTTQTTTETNTTTAASLPPIVAVPPPTTTTPTTTSTTTTTTPTTTTRTTTTSTTTRTTTTTTRTTTTSATTTKTSTTTRTLTTPTTPPPKLGGSVTPAVSVTVAQARTGSATFSGCTGNWGVAPTGRVAVASPTGSAHADTNGGTSTVGQPSDRRL